MTDASISDDDLFELRYARSRDDLWSMLDRVYGAHADYGRFRKALDRSLRKAWAERPADLKRLDLRRDLEPDWFQRPDMTGYVPAGRG